MKRRLIKQGADALTLTVPKEWTKLHHLKSGDEVDLTTDGAMLLIHAQPSNQKRKTRIHLSKENQKLHRMLLAQAYRSGFEEIEITYEKATQLANMYVLIEELLGMEITHQNEKMLTLQSVAIPDYQQYNTLFRRIFHIIESGFSYLAADAQSGELDSQKIEALQKNLLRNSNFCIRILCNYPFEDKNKVFAEQVMIKVADYVMSELSQVYTLLPKKISSRSMKYLHDCKTFFSSITEAIFKEDQRLLVRLLTQKQDFFERKKKIFTEVEQKEYLLVQELSILLRLLTLFVGPITSSTLHKLD